VVALDDKLIQISRLGRIQCLEGEIIKNQKLDPDELSHLGVVARVEAGRSKSPVETVGAFEMHADPSECLDRPLLLLGLRGRAASRRIGRSRPG